MSCAEKRLWPAEMTPVTSGGDQQPAAQPAASSQQPAASSQQQTASSQHAQVMKDVETVELNNSSTDRSPTTTSKGEVSDECSRPRQSWINDLDLEEEEENPAKQNLTALQRIAFSSRFAAGTTALICVNGVIIGVETDHGDGSLGWQVLEIVFLILYTVELMIRLGAGGLRAFCTDSWIPFDAGLLATAYIDMCIITPLADGDGTAKQLAMVLRIIRLLKLARIIRLLRFFKELWLLVASFASSMKTLMWTFFLLVIVLYVFAILFVKMLGHVNDDPDIVEWFGNMPSAMFTLVQILTLEGWSDICRKIWETDQGFMIFAVFVFILICSFAVLNTVMAVIVEHTMCEADDQQDDILKKEREEHEAVSKDLIRVFHKADTDKSGMLSLEEFVTAMKDPKVRKILDLMDLGTDIAYLEAEELAVFFHTIDVDSNNELSPEEFVEGMMRMRGKARARGIFELHCDMQKKYKVMVDTVSQVSSKHAKLKNSVNSLESAVAAQQKSIDKMLLCIHAISSAHGVNPSDTNPQDNELDLGVDLVIAMAEHSLKAEQVLPEKN